MNRYYYVWSNKVEEGKVYTDKDIRPPFNDREKAIAFAKEYFEANPHVDIVEVFEFGVDRPIITFERKI